MAPNYNSKAVLSQGKPRDAAVNLHTYVHGFLVGLCLQTAVSVKK